MCLLNSFAPPVTVSDRSLGEVSFLMDVVVDDNDT